MIVGEGDREDRALDRRDAYVENEPEISRRQRRVGDLIERGGTCEDVSLDVRESVEAAG